MFGYHDRVAWIDLTRSKIEVRPIGEEDAQRYVGGANLGAAYLARLTDGDTDPLGPDNPLIYMTGPFTATGVPGGSRHEIIALSPQTGIYGESNSGGAFGRHLKLSGLDGIVFTGASDKPVALVIDGDRMHLRDARDWWGKDVFETDDAVQAEFGKGTISSVIGPAGENKVLLACIAHDGRETRMAGRCGMGAVMGSKNLKAVVITRKGKTLHPLADEEGLAASTREITPKMRDSLSLFVKYGTPGSLGNFERLGNLPIENWRRARATELAEKIYGITLADTIMVRRAGCKRCPFQCARVVNVEEGPYAINEVVEGPEYETLGSFGSMQMVDNLEAISKANELCNRYGLDTISTGTTIAFANECFEKGILTAADTDGLQLGFNRPDENIELVRRIAFADSEIGRILGQGERRAAQVLGHGAQEYAVEVKGLEMPMHDPRFSWSHALSYATGNRGACHLTSLGHAFEIGITYPEIGYKEPAQGRVADDKARLVCHLQNMMNMRDSLIFCNFTLINNAAKATHFVEWYNHVTGRSIDFDEFDFLGARGFTLKRMINNRRGITRKDDDLPPRMRTLRKKGQDIDFDVPPLYPMLSEYYDLRGWCEEGRPTAETVKKYGLEEFA
jgi:aldehyde:ferredoxin oxidoreductase